VFEMGDRGLAEVPNPSSLFLADRAVADPDAPEEETASRLAGAAVFAGIEGTRPVLVEVQALVAPSPLGTPRRAVVGWDANRLAMLTAVLDARCGLSVGPNDIYLNIAGGLRIVEPAADLAVAAALISALTEIPVPHDIVVFGEIALSGRVRPVAHADLRLKEAAKLGFTEAWVPPRPSRGAKPVGIDGLKTALIGHLSELVALLSPSPSRRDFSPNRSKRTPPAGAPRVMVTR
jgi:DNA repair protein RadA/Sms